ncbi:TPA: FAD-dependent oxidoreductase [Klebsiella pneumoniae]
MSHYPHLFSPLTINGMTLKNRIIMPPMGTNMATLNGEVSQEQLEYYELRAKGGTGLITIENICIDFPFASNGTTQLRIDNDQYIPRLFKLTETLHKHGACVSIQLNHAGASAYAYRLEGQTPLSSSTTPSKKHGNIPRPMTHEEIYHAVEKFGDAAERVRRAGFDCVEIHAGHSYLISQFLSPLFNKRTDEFGGSVENRTRILSLIVDKVRACVGPRFPVSLRISADDFLKGGNTLEDSLRILELCQEKVDIINVSAAQNDNLNLQIDQMSLEDGWKRYLSRAVRDKFHKPTVIAGNIRTPQVAEDILASGDADLIAIGRGLIAEPEWVQKVQGGKERLMRKCISCNIGCADHRIARSRPLRCSINPDIIHGDAYKMRRVNRDTNVVVIGAGAVGLDVIEYFTARGAQAVLIEMQDAAGRDLDIITKNAMLTMLDEHQVEQHMNTQLMAVAADHFQVKNTQQTFDIPFDYGFVCLGMRANRTGLDEIERWANANNVKIMNIGDSVMARRIIDGVREGRNVLDALEDMGALGSREAQRIPFLTY